MKNEKMIIGLAAITIIAFGGWAAWHKTWQEKFKAPSSDWQSEKQVEDYFVEKLKMPDETAMSAANLGIEFRISKDATLDAIIGNLTYYGLARDKDALKYALEQTKDTTPGKPDALHVGNNTLDTDASYYLTKNMTVWQLADTLLNKPYYWDFDQYNYIFMPYKPES